VVEPNALLVTVLVRNYLDNTWTFRCTRCQEEWTEQSCAPLGFALVAVQCPTCQAYQIVLWTDGVLARGPFNAEIIG
jgi:hypothetical protein